MNPVSSTPHEKKETILTDIMSTLNRFPKTKDSNSDVSNNPVVLRNQKPCPLSVRNSNFSNSYCDEWDRLFADESGTDTMLDCLREAGLNGEMINSRFRSICWRLYLGVISKDKTRWVEDIQQHRNMYDQLKQQFIVDPRNSQYSETCENPLSQDDLSVWNKFFIGSESKRQIHQDVVRTFPEVEFFHDENIRTNMVNVLFCFSQTSQLSYKQGMHEVLAPLIFVLHCDHMAYQHSKEIGSLSTELSECADKLLDHQYIEHDAFILFKRIMEIIGPWYDVKEIPNPPKVGQEPFQKTADYAAASCAGVARLNRIRDTLLRDNDLELYLHLERLEIVSQMYGLRWIRLLFGREFTLQDLLVVWDALFALHENLILVDYIFVAMLIQVRDLLLKSDFSESLCLLMRYPPGVDAHYIVATALHLYKPLVYVKPAEQAYQQIFYTKNQKRKNHVVQRNRTSVGLDLLTSRLKNAEIFQRFQGINFSGLIRRPERPALLLDKSSIKTRHHSSVERSIQPRLSATRAMESAPVTPTQDPITRTPSSASSTRKSPLSSTDFQEFIEIRLPHERRAEADTLRELLELCAFCYSELDSCVDMMRICVEDCQTKQPWSATLPEHLATQAIYDTGNLKTTMNRMSAVRDLLGGISAGMSSPRPEPKTSQCIPRSVSTQNLSSDSSFCSPGKTSDPPASKNPVGNDGKEVELQEFTPLRRIIWDK